MPYLTPDSIPEETACRSLLIPDDSAWLALVSGAISELAQEYNWEQGGAVTTEEAAQTMLQMWLSFVDSACTGGTCRRIFRVNISGEFEQSDDGGETWEAPMGDAAVPPVPQREEPTAEERRCLAAANAANVLAQTYEQMLDAWALDHEIDYGIAVFGAIMLGVIGAWLKIISVASINMAIGVFASAYEILDNLTQDAWDVEFNDQLKCILYEVSSDVAGVVTFDYNVFLYRVTELIASNPVEQALLVAQIQYMMLWIGGDGLNAAGATTAITEADCCPEGWCYRWDFEVSDQGWIAFNDGVAPRAVYTPGLGWGRNPSHPNFPYLIQIQKSGFSAPDVDGWGMEWDVTASTGDSVQLRMNDVAGSVYASGGRSVSATNEFGLVLASPTPSSGLWVSYDPADSTLGRHITAVRIGGAGENPIGENNCL